MDCNEKKENTNENQGGHKHSPMNHMLMMVLCCGLPIILLIVVVPFLGIFGTGFKLTVASIIPFLCPVMMLFMIPMMLKSSKDSKSCCSEDKEKEKIALPDKKL